MTDSENTEVEKLILKRNPRGQHLLFTQDGKPLANQLEAGVIVPPNGVMYIQVKLAIDGEDVQVEGVAP